MLDHMTFRVRNLAATRAFYESALAPLGYRLGHEGEHDGVRMLGFEQGGKFDTWFVEAPNNPSGPTHLAWHATTRAAVDAFYKAAMANGGRDNGPPGLRPHYHPNYYGAFVFDPDGNNVEAVCHDPE
jgi:catechol 2,3-dioxygenase-like lactoylglutathione lyase family enzyme